MNARTGKDDRGKSRIRTLLGKSAPVLIIVGALVVLGMILSMSSKKFSFRESIRKVLLRLAESMAVTESEETAKETPAVNVKVAVVNPLPELADTLNLPGRIEPNRVVRVAAEVAGRIEGIPCKEGATCKAGDLLIRLNDELLQAEFNRTAAQHTYDKQEYERFKSLVSGGAATEKQRDDAKSRMDVSKAEMESAHAQLERARVYSPAVGVLNDLLVEKGEYVQPGTPVVEIVDITTVKVVVHMPERDIHFFKTGGATAITLADGLEEGELSGEITYISELADESTRSTRMEITLDNRARRLKSGQIVQVQLTRRTLKDVIMIPLLVVIPMEDAKAVYVVEGNRAVRRVVKLGLIKGRAIRVTDGLNPGDRLIIVGHRYVGPGQSVKITNRE